MPIVKQETTHQKKVSVSFSKSELAQVIADAARVASGLSPDEGRATVHVQEVKRDVGYSDGHRADVEITIDLAAGTEIDG